MNTKNELVKKHLKSVYYIAGEFQRNEAITLTRDEIIASAFVGFYKAVDSFDSAKEFLPYASQAIRNEILLSIKSQNLIKKMWRKIQKARQRIFAFLNNEMT